MRIETCFVPALLCGVLTGAAPGVLLPEAFAQSGSGTHAVALAGTPAEAPENGPAAPDGADSPDSARVALGEVRIVGLDAARLRMVEAEVAFGAGASFDPVRLEADIGRMLAILEREGLPLAAASVETIGPSGDAADRLAVALRVEPGPEVALRRFDPEGARRAKPKLMARLAGMKPGAKILRFDAERIRRRIEGKELFEAVGAPVLRIAADTTAVVRIPVEEGPPGVFDLALGYLPPSERGGRGSVTGSGRLALRNPFGRGLAASLRLHRLPDQVSTLDVSAGWPFPFGLPLGLEAGFSGLEEDSTYGKRAWRGQISYDLAPGMSAFAVFSRERTASGSLRGGGKRLPRRGRVSSGWGRASRTWTTGRIPRAVFTWR